MLHRLFSCHAMALRLHWRTVARHARHWHAFGFHCSPMVCRITCNLVQDYVQFGIYVVHIRILSRLLSVLACLTCFARAPERFAPPPFQVGGAVRCTETSPCGVDCMAWRAPHDGAQYSCRTEVCCKLCRGFQAWSPPTCDLHQDHVSPHTHLRL